MRQGVFGELGHPKYTEYIEDISRSAQHLLLLINDVLDISKIEAEKLEITEAEIDIGTVMDMCASMLEPQSTAKSLTFSVTHPSESTYLRGDDAKLRQIIINLLANAIKFTPERGSVHLMAECAPAGSIVFKVADSGIGIPAEDIERVQQPFEHRGEQPRRFTGRHGPRARDHQTLCRAAWRRIEDRKRTRQRHDRQRHLPAGADNSAYVGAPEPIRNGFVKAVSESQYSQLIEEGRLTGRLTHHRAQRPTESCHTHHCPSQIPLYLF